MKSFTLFTFLTLLNVFLLTKTYGQTNLGTFQVTNQAQPQNAPAVLNLRSHQHNAILSYKGYQYVAFYSVNGNNLANRFVNIGRRKLPGGSWEILKFNDYVQKANDSHNVISLGICEGNGTIHMIFDQHNGSVPLRYRVSVAGLATNPQNHNWTANKFGNVLGTLPGTTSNSIANKNITYPRFISMPNGNLQLIRRHGSAISGASHIYTYNKNNSKWTHHGEFINGRIVEYVKPDTGRRTKLGPYLNGANYHNGRLHVTWIWRTEGQSSNNNFDFMYAYSDDYGITWKNKEGVVAGRAGNPMTYKNSVPVRVFNFPEGTGLINQTGQTVDDNGRVHVYQTRNAAGGRRFNHLYLNNNNKWIKNETNISSQRGKITHDSNGNVYAIHKSGSIFKATSDNNFKDWSIIRNNNNYTGEAQYDENRMENEGIISMLVAEPGASKKMHTVDIQVSEKNPNQAPIVRFINPNTDLSVNEGYDLVVEVDATDTDGMVEKTSLFINDVLIREETRAPYLWGHNGSPNPEELNGLPPGKHEIKVVATDNSGESTEVSITLTVNATLSTKDIQVAPLSLYPIPATHMINLSTRQLQGKEIEVFNTSGVLVQKLKISADFVELDITSFRPGVYFIKLAGPVKTKASKFIKI